MIQALIADDSAIMRKIIRTNLEKIGISHIEESRNGEETVTMLRGERINLLFLDLNMPEPNGFEILKRLEYADVLKSLNVIIISSELTPALCEQLRSYPLGGFIPKPFDIRVFNEVVLPLVALLSREQEDPRANNIIHLRALFSAPPEIYIEHEDIVIEQGGKSVRFSLALLAEHGIFSEGKA